MAHGRKQQILEATQHMRADSVGLKAAGQADDQKLVYGNRKVIRPKMYQPFNKRGWRVESGVSAGAGCTAC